MRIRDGRAVPAFISETRLSGESFRLWSWRAAEGLPPWVLRWALPCLAAALCLPAALLPDLVERGLDPEQGILFVIDGAKALQREWKTVGIVPRDQDNALWEEFRGHCNAVFERSANEAAAFAEALAAAAARAEAHAGPGRTTACKLG